MHDNFYFQFEDISYIFPNFPAFFIITEKNQQRTQCHSKKNNK